MSLDDLIKELPSTPSAEDLPKKLSNEFISDDEIIGESTPKENEVTAEIDDLFNELQSTPSPSKDKVTTEDLPKELQTEFMSDDEITGESTPKGNEFTAEEVVIDDELFDQLLAELASS